MASEAPDEEKSMAVSSDMAIDQVGDGDIEMSQLTKEIEDQDLTDAEKSETPEAAGKKSFTYRWEVRNFSQLVPEKVKSEMFSAFDYQWKILLFPKGDGTDHLSLYLESANTNSFPSVHLHLTVINHSDDSRSVLRDIRGQVNTERCLGFKCFMPLDDLLDPKRNFLEDDILIVKADVFSCIKEEDPGDMEKDNLSVENEVTSSVTTKNDGYERIKEEGGIYESGKDSGYLGIKNHGLTCYMNSVIQALYHIPSFRKAVYEIPTTKDEVPSESTPLALQKLFYMLQFGKSCASTIELAASFGSRWQSFMMQDVAEFCRFLTSQLEEKMKTSRNVLEQLFEVCYLQIIESRHVDDKSTVLEKSKEVILPVKDCSGVYASFDKLVEPELLDEKYESETMHGDKDARKYMNAKFTHFPPVLRLQLGRFKHNANGNIDKSNDYYEFPLELDLDRGDGKYLAPEADKNIQNRYVLHSVLAHIGNMTAGHYYAFIRPTLSDDWYKFNDEIVTKENAENAIPRLFGGNDEGTMEANAYMLVYIRESDKDNVMCSVPKEVIPHHLEERFLKDQTKAHEVKRKIDYEELEPTVRFRSLTDLQDKFTLALPVSLPYDAVVGRVAEHLGVDDHSRIQLTSHNIYTQKPNSEPIQKCNEHDLLQMLHHNKELLNILYYELLDVPPQETEGFKTLTVEFHPPATCGKVDTQTIRISKTGTVGDLLDILRTKVCLSHAGADLRMFEVFGQKIYKVFSPKEKISDLNDQYMILRAEEISEEEKNLGPKDRMIRVYHYSDVMHVQVFGYPFFLVIHEEESFADIKPRLQKKAGVSDTEFARWKFAFLGLGYPEYLKDSDVLIRYFEREDKETSVAWQPFLGLEHTNYLAMDVD